jgi:hypothetical protein
MLCVHSHQHLGEHTPTSTSVNERRLVYATEGGPGCCTNEGGHMPNEGGHCMNECMCWWGWALHKWGCALPNEDGEGGHAAGFGGWYLYIINEYILFVFILWCIGNGCSLIMPVIYILVYGAIENYLTNHAMELWGTMYYIVATTQHYGALWTFGS